MKANEEEISLLQLIPLCYRVLRMNHAKREHGLTKSQLMILTALHRRKELTMSQVADCISSSKEQATRAVSPLVEAGYVARTEDSGNRTHICVHLTEAGRTVLENLCAEIHTSLNERIDTALNAEEKAELNSALETMITLLSKVQ